MRDSGVRPPVATEPPSVEERVRVIALEMECGAWSAAKARDLASRWGLSLSTVRDAAAEASRSLRSLDREAARARVEAILDQAATAAKGDASAMVKVATALMKLHGLDRPQSGASGQVDTTTTASSSGERPPPPPGFEEEPESDS